ncbi:hypothetical protein AX17_006367 [Amanita inopinata Kibby_2008]|nr:hypothetical protein AX17_006367 [Amanita inopinata Kibby_2008]
MTGFVAVSLEQGNGPQRFKGVSRILGPPWAHLPALTVGLLGVQVFWSVEMSYASPYLLSLGLSKSSMAVVFLAGPLSGLIMQPLIGVLADNSTSRFGRRRPYMLLGTTICMLAMLLLGFTRPIASIFTGWNNDANDILTIWLAVLAIYLIDFSINAVQAVDRALLIDTIPPSAQPAGNAWAARMLGIGSVIGFFVGNINLPDILPFLGKSQLEVLSVVVSLLLFAGHITMAMLVKEKILLKDDSSNIEKKSFSKELRDIWHGMLTLPPVIRKICIIQFFAWLSWFPILFYTTIYIGDLYKRAFFASATSPLSDEDQITLNAEATRSGSRALFCSSLVSLIGNVVLPYFVSEAARELDSPSERRIKPPGRRYLGSATDSTETNGNYGPSGVETGRHTWRAFLAKISSSLRVPQGWQFHLASLWAFSHLVISLCMFGTFLTSSVFGATMLITITGFSWAITQWAPFSLLGEAILTEHASGNIPSTISLLDSRTRDSADGEREVFLPGIEEDSEDEVDEQAEDIRHSKALGTSAARISHLDVGDHDHSAGGSEDNREPTGENRRNGDLSSKAGIILGIHNVFIVIPQFLVTGLSAIIFAIFDPNKSVLPTHHGAAHGAGGAPGAPTNGTVINMSMSADVPGLVRSFLADLLSREGDDMKNQDSGNSNSVVYIFRLGGVAAAIACVLCWRLSRELKHRGL